MSATLLWLCAVFVVVTGAGARKHQKEIVCEPKGQFYFNMDRGECVPCSLCPENQIPKRLCWGNIDTHCGPFVEFSKHPDKGTNVLLEDGGKTAKDTEEVYPSEKLTSPRQLEVDADVTDPWFKVTMILVGVLVLTAVVVVALGVLACYVCRKQKREMERDPVYRHALLSSEENGVGKVAQFRVVKET